MLITIGQHIQIGIFDMAKNASAGGLSFYLFKHLSLSLSSHCDSWTVQVEPNAHRIEEHRRKYERLHKEREERKNERERQRRRAEAQVTFLCLVLYKMIQQPFCYENDNLLVHFV